jgi:hypothetical protein
MERLKRSKKKKIILTEEAKKNQILIAEKSQKEVRIREVRKKAPPRRMEKTEMIKTKKVISLLEAFSIVLTVFSPIIINSLSNDLLYLLIMINFQTHLPFS